MGVECKMGLVSCIFCKPRGAASNTYKQGLLPGLQNSTEVEDRGA